MALCRSCHVSYGLHLVRKKDDDLHGHPQDLLQGGIRNKSEYKLTEEQTVSVLLLPWLTMVVVLAVALVHALRQDQ
jgi:hypothetical protein